MLLFSKKKIHSQEIVIYSAERAADFLLTQTHRELVLKCFICFLKLRSLIGRPFPLCMSCTQAGLGSLGAVDLSPYSEAMILPAPWPPDLSPRGVALPLLPGRPGLWKWKLSQWFPQKSPRKHCYKPLKGEWLPVLLQTKEQIKNYGIYFTRESKEHHFCFQFKMQSQMKYPSSHSLLEWNSNHSSLRLLPLFLSVLEQRQPTVLKNHTAVCLVNLWMRGFSGVFLGQLMC